MNDKHDSRRDQALQQSMVDALDQSIEHLDAHTLSRLNQARHKALEYADRPRLLSSQWLKAATFAVLLVTIVNGWLFFSTPQIQQQLDSDDLELLLASDDYELVQELDFIAWMIEEEHAG